MITYLICIPLAILLVLFFRNAYIEFAEMSKTIRENIEKNEKELERLSKMNEKFSQKR
jgi:hypothetical protein